LFELNYEFSDLEALEGFDDDPGQHYADFERRAYEVDQAKLAFVREIAMARTGFAQPWLVYGTMMRSLAVACSNVDLDYHLYNVHRSQAHYDEKGMMTVESVVHSVWLAPDGRVGFFFVNLGSDEAQTLTLEIDPMRYHVSDATQYSLRQVTGETEDDLFTGAGCATVDVTLAPRKVTMIELQTMMQ